MNSKSRFLSLFLSLVILLSFNTTAVFAAGSNDYKVIIKNEVVNNAGEYVKGAQYDIYKTHDYALSGSFKKLEEPKPIYKDIVVNEKGVTLDIPEKGIYEVVQVKRAPGHYLAGTKDEVYKAVIEYPVIKGGFPAKDQTLEVVPKLDPILVDVNLFKKGEDTSHDNDGLNGVTFELVQTHDNQMRKFKDAEFLSRGLRTANGGYIELKSLTEGIYELREVGVGKSDGTDADKIYADPEGTHLMDNKPVILKVTATEDGKDSIVYQLDEDLKIKKELPISEDTGISGLHRIYEVDKLNYRVPDVEKKVNGSDEHNTNIGKEFEYEIKTKIPTNIKNYKEFKVIDELDSRLDYVKDSVVVKIGSQEIKDEKLFIKEFISSDNKLEVRANDIELLDEYANEELRVIFKAKLNREAESGNSVPNKGKLVFDTGSGVEKTKETNIVKVNPQEGSIKVVKVDKDDHSKKLAGAVFVLKDAKSGDIAKDTRGEEFRATTDGNGEVVFEKVPFGDYELVEEKAPTGYRLTTEVNKIRLNDNSPSLEYVFQIENEKLITDPDTPQDLDDNYLPETGVSSLIMLVGLSVVSLALGVVVRKYEDEE